ncbi:MAG: fibronectin type domain protein [Candidatus Saccharibacteria bacterium]|nr:fibronectin type domain protein [Candidatus Saccharibacteria bacterium]
MIILKATTESLQITSSSTAGLDYSISYADITTTTFTPSTNEGKISTATTTSILAAPAASTQRQVKLITIANTHATVSNQVYIQKLISATAYMQTPIVTLLAGEAFQYMDGSGWTYYSSTGQIKNVQTAAGSNTQLQYNASGALTGDAGLTYDATNDILGLNTATSSISMGAYVAGVAPATPASGTHSIFSRTVANRGLVAGVDQFGTLTSYQPILGRNKVGYWNPQGPGASVIVPGVFGLPALTSNATTPVVRTIATTNLATRMRRIGYPSTATAGTFAGIRLATQMVSAGSGASDGSGFMLIERWVESDPASVTGRRAFHGMTVTTGAFTNVEVNGLLNQVGICQLSTDATQWYWAGAGTSAQTATAVGTAIGAPGGNSTTAWELAIYAPNGAANTFYLQLTNVTTGVVATKTFTGSATTVPVSTVLLSWNAWATNNATALAVGIDLCSLYLETDN